jgi:hypothetical protein
MEVQAKIGRQKRKTRMKVQDSFRFLLTNAHSPIPAIHISNPPTNKPTTNPPNILNAGFGGSEAVLVLCACLFACCVRAWLHVFLSLYPPYSFSHIDLDDAKKQLEYEGSEDVDDEVSQVDDVDDMDEQEDDTEEEQVRA